MTSPTPTRTSSSWLVCFIWLKEPESGFADEYYLSSVDKMLEEQEQLKAEGKA